MNKLIEHKMFLTFDEAAKYLSTALGEEVTPSDVEHMVCFKGLQACVIARNWVVYYSKPFKHEDGMEAGQIVKVDGNPDNLISGVYPIDLFNAFRAGGFDGRGLDLEIEDGKLARCFEFVATESPCVSRSWLPLSAHRRPSTEAEHLVIRPQDLRTYLDRVQAAEETEVAATPEKFQLKTQRQEDAVLNTLRKLGVDPKALPARNPKDGNKPGIKSKAKEKILADHKGLFTKSAFMHAWDRLLKDKRIAYKNG